MRQKISSKVLPIVHPGPKSRALGLFRCWAWLSLLALAPDMALAGATINAASINTTEGRVRIVLESAQELRFSLFILRSPDRVVINLDGVELNPILARLAEQVGPDHPYLNQLQVERSSPDSTNVQVKFILKRESESVVEALKPQVGHGYQLVLHLLPNVQRDTPALAIGLPAAAPTPAPMPAVAAVPAVPSRAGAEADVLLLQVQLDEEVLAESITSYQHDGETFLPLGELARLLTVGISTQPAQGTAAGYVLQPAREFYLNVAQARVTPDGPSQLFPPALVRVYEDDIYVASSLLSRWLPLDLDVNLSSLLLKVRPRERLPLQERMERERKGARTAARSVIVDKRPVYPLQATPYRLLGVPFIDQTLGVSVRGGKGTRVTSANYTAYLTGDLLGMESALFVASSKQDRKPNLRFSLARNDPAAGLLGPMRARSVMFGSAVAAPSVLNVTNTTALDKGYGLAVSNRPATQPTSFDRHTLRGDLPPGWDVELYFNEALVGFQASRADGRYSFDDQPLAYGVNEFRLVFSGPLGQQRIERQSFLLAQSSTPPGEFYYNLALHRNEAGQSRTVGQFEWGINKYVAATGGFVQLPAVAGNLDSDDQVYTHLGVRSYLGSFILSSDFFKGSKGGWLNESGVKTRLAGVSVSYSRTQLHNYTSEIYLPSGDMLRTRDKVRLDGAIPAGFLPRLPITLELQHNLLASGLNSLDVAGRVAAFVNRTAVSNQLNWHSSSASTSASGALQLSRRVGSVGLSGQLGYSIRPDISFNTIALSGDTRLGAGYLLNLGLVRMIDSRDTLGTLGINKQVGRYGFGVNSSYSRRGAFSVGVQLFMSMSREPRQGAWRFDAMPRATSGAASALVFMDNNGNGIMDAGEPPLPNTAVTVNGNRTSARTNASGIAWIDNLPEKQYADLAVDTQTLEDPYWMPLRKGTRVLPRPGHVAQIDFPVILTSEIDGTVFLGDKSARRGVGDVSIELLDAAQKVVATTRSGSDGYYIIPAVPQGSYAVRISPQQIATADLVDPGTRTVTILPDGEFVNGIDFVLFKNSATKTDSP